MLCPHGAIVGATIGAIVGAAVAPIALFSSSGNRCSDPTGATVAPTEIQATVVAIVGAIVAPIQEVTVNHLACTCLVHL